jgi:hypothetical protein
MEDEEEIKKGARISPKTAVIGVVVLLVLAGLGGSYFFFNKYQKSQALLKDPTAAQQIEIKEVTGKIAKLMDLPEGEEPSIATVLDKDKLKDQAFFAKAENGDKVVIYSKTGLAILYRTSVNRIINVSPINLGNQTGTATTPISIAVYNGTPTAGLTTKFATDIVKLITNLNVSSKANAGKNSYERSVIVDLTGKNADTVKELATLLDGDVSTLPEGEVKPADATTEVLVILGANYTSPALVPSTAPVATPAGTQ